MLIFGKPTEYIFMAAETNELDRKFLNTLTEQQAKRVLERAQQDSISCLAAYNRIWDEDHAEDQAERKAFHHRYW